MSEYEFEIRCDETAETCGAEVYMHAGGREFKIGDERESGVIIFQTPEELNDEYGVEIFTDDIIEHAKYVAENHEYDVVNDVTDLIHEGYVTV